MSLTQDKMRADIAQALDVTVQAIGNDDNLFDLGLDSMRLMALAMDWQEVMPELDFGLLMEGQTLGEWWASVEAQRQIA